MESPNKKSLKEIVNEEYIKCLTNPMYFMKKYVKIQHPVKGTIPFDLYPFQEKTLEQFPKQNRVVILKSRQMGITTLISAYSLWLMVFHKDKNILVISIKQEVSKEIVTRVRFANDNLPSWLKLENTENNRLSLKLSNGSMVKATSSADSAGRSAALSLLIIDEAAFIDKAGDIWVSSLPTLSTGGQAIVLSTPNGVGNWFHKLWVDAEEKRNDFYPVSLPWNLHPERDQLWRDEQTRNAKSPKHASQECDCSFLTSGTSVFDLSLLLEYKKKIREPIEVRGFDKGLWLWEYAKPEGTYIVCADVARGDGGDFSACHVLDAETLVQVAEYKGKLDTKEFGNLLVTLATEFNNALLIIERENVGWAVIQQVLDRNYENTFYSSSDLKYVDVHKQMTNKFAAEEKQLVAGFSTTSKTRPLVISKFDLYFKEAVVTLNSSRILSEMEVFTWINGKPQAMDGYNDDLIMSMCIGLWVRDTALRLKQEAIELSKAALNGFDVKTSTLSPLYKSIGYKNNLQDQWKMNTGKPNIMEDIKWLL